MSKLRPILFNTEMVQAIMEDRKRQTRRVMKPQPHPDGQEIIDHGKPWSKGKGRWLSRFKISTNPDRYGIASAHDCPYGKIGDVLWVRETHLYVSREHAHDLLEGSNYRTQWVYKTSVHEDWFQYAKEKYGHKWKPSIHMPFEACRFFLEITNIRVERLQEISENDAIKEGLISLDYKGHPSYTHNKDKYPNGFGTATGCFSHLWQSVYGSESWNANPWVWVIEFKQIPKPIALLTPTR